ncbi:MAG: DUF4012 domain-containing protein [bacterium]|nr:DUF4012 domain-containing protein [bacterium]
MSFKKFKKLKVRPGAKSSRFVVDLKQDLAIAEMKESKYKKNLIVESRLEKLAELDYGKILKAGSQNAKKNFSVYTKLICSRNFWVSALARLSPPVIAENVKVEKSIIIGKLNNGKIGKFWDKINGLAFVVLAKVIFAVLKQAIILVYKISYWLGWIIIFTLRLVYFSLLALIRPVIKAIGYLIARLQPIISVGLNIVSGGFKAARSVATAILSKRFIFEERDCEPVPSNCEGSAFAVAPRNDRWSVSYLRPVLVFAGILLIMILPVKAYTYYKTIDSAKGKVLGASESAMNNLISGGQAAANLDFNRADESFTQAGNNFLIAENQLKEINDLLFTLGSIVPDKNIQLAAASKHIVRAGGLSAEAGKNLSLAVESLFNYQANDSRGILLNLSVYGHKAIVSLTDLSKELDQINSEVIPEPNQRNFIILKQKIGEINRGLSEFINLTDKLESFLGGESAKRYLLIFQNNSELRASGGFIGSFALIDILDGKIKSLLAPGGGSYDTDAGLLKKIKSPEPLALVRADWHFWDANWWPDWSASAKKLAWFYENSDGSTVDGVIGFTPTVMEKILRVLGPIDLKEKYGVIIDADNFWQVTQEFAEQKPNVTKEPKKIIGDLLDKIIKELPERLNKNNLIPMLKAIEESLTDKNILFYFTDKELQDEVKNLGWAGEIKATQGDYLSVINTNIAGGKSDRKINQEIIHQAEVQPDGSIIDNLTIKRTHEAINRQPFSGVRNVNWLRVYVPLGSELIEASGFKPVDKIFFKTAEESWQNDPEVFASESRAKTDAASGTKIYNELGKTVFANWSQLDPGETIEINIKYQLPFKLTDENPDLTEGLMEKLIAKAGEVINPKQKNLYSYSLLAQKQPGMNSSIIESKLKLSDNFKTIWQYPADLSINQDGWFRTENLDQDKIMAVMVEEK